MKGFFDEVHFFAVSVAGHIHDDIFDAVGIGNFVKQESFAFAGALHVDIAVIENGWEETFDFARGVLDAKEKDVAHVSNEKTALFDIDDAFIGDNPDVQIVVYPNQETEKPEENEEGVFDEEKKGAIDRAQEVGRENAEDDDGADDNNRSHHEGNKLYENIEPVTVNHEENFFIGILSFEVKGSVEIFSGNHHTKIFKSQFSISKNFKKSFRCFEWWARESRVSRRGWRRREKHWR